MNHQHCRISIKTHQQHQVTTRLHQGALYLHTPCPLKMNETPLQQSPAVPVCFHPPLLPACPRPGDWHWAESLLVPVGTSEHPNPHLELQCSRCLSCWCFPKQSVSVSLGGHGVELINPSKRHRVKRERQLVLLVTGGGKCDPRGEVHRSRSLRALHPWRERDRERERKPKGACRNLPFLSLAMWTKTRKKEKRSDGDRKSVIG